MLPWLRRRKPQPRTDAEALAQAFAEVKKQQTRRAVRKRRAFLWRKYADPRILLVVGLIFVVLIWDGTRRENREFFATVTQVSGAGRARAAAGESARPLAVGMQLQDGGEVVTGQGCWAVLDFPDGSVITLAPGSHFVVELLEYSRGGRWRGRSFTLNVGQLWARVSPKFGEQSRCRIHTPSSVAAVRGTRLCVTHDAERAATQIACSDGAVRVDGFRGRAALVVGGGTTAVSYGQPPAARGPIDAQTRSSFAHPTLNREVRPDGWLKRTELRITSALDLPLSLLGIGRSSWAIGAADFARRTAAMEALRYIHQSVHGYAEFPEFVDPFTLRELDFRSEDARRLLRSFDGAALEKYERTSTGFIIWARARDKARTPFRLTAYGVEQITEEQMQGL